jgi:hypothetical protein
VTGAEASIAMSDPVAVAIIGFLALWGLVLWWHDKMAPKLRARRQRRRLRVPDGPRYVDTSPRPLDKGWK